MGKPNDFLKVFLIILSVVLLVSAGYWFVQHLDLIFTESKVDILWSFTFLVCLIKLVYYLIAVFAFANENIIFCYLVFCVTILVLIFDILRLLLCVIDQSEEECSKGALLRIILDCFGDTVFLVPNYYYIKQCERPVHDSR